MFMGLSLTKPSRTASRRRGTVCRQFECASPKDDEYWLNTVSGLQHDCRNSNSTHLPECRAMNKDPRFKKAYVQTFTSNKQYLKKPDPKYECRLGDHFRRPGCQALLKTVHPRWVRRTDWV
jgi:hypothetical protein